MNIQFGSVNYIAPYEKNGYSNLYDAGLRGYQSLPTGASSYAILDTKHDSMHLADGHEAVALHALTQLGQTDQYRQAFQDAGIVDKLEDIFLSHN